MAFIEWINERVLFIDMHTNWYQWYCGHFSGVVNEWCFNCHLDTNHINCGRDQGILTSNCGIMNFVAWKNKFPIFCFHKGTGIIYHQEQSLGHQRQHNAGQCLFWHWVTAQAPGAAPLPPQRVKTTPSPQHSPGLHTLLSFSLVAIIWGPQGWDSGLRTAWKMLSRGQTWSLALGRIMFPLLNVLL